MPSCDIIIPAFKSAASLSYVLPALLEQAYPPSWQLRLLISDDGSADRTVSRARELTGNAPWPVEVLTGPHGGPAAARNRALARADAELIFFLGADIMLRPGALARHLRFHEAHRAGSDAALGMVVWDPRLRPSPLMEWLMHGGPQNDFDSLLGSPLADPAHCFYASHLSIKRRELPPAGFAREYRGYGWEDLDLGRRAGTLRLHVLHQAIGLHRHAYQAADVQRRQQAAGRNLVVYQQRFPDIALIPPRGRLHFFKHYLLRRLGLAAALRLLVQYGGSRRSLPRIFSLSSAAELWAGIYTADAYPHNGATYPHNFPQ